MVRFSGMKRWLSDNIVRGFHVFPGTAFKKSAAGGLGSFAFFALSLYGIRGYSLDAVFRATEYLGWIFATGFPIVLTAAFLFCSEKSHERFVQATLQNNRLRFIPLFLTYLLFSCVMMSLAVSIGVILLIGITSSAQVAFYLPQLVGAALVVTLIFSPIPVLVAMGMDGCKSAIPLGMGLFTAITVATGQPHYPLAYPELAFYGPAHLLTSLFFILIGGFAESYCVECYIGLRITPFDLLLPVSILSIVSLVCLLVSKRWFHSNLQRLVVYSDEWKTETAVIPDIGKADGLQTPSEISEHYDFRRKTMASSIVILVLIIPLSSIGYTAARKQEWRTVVYESPVGGEVVQIGQWLAEEFQGVEPGPNVDLCVQCEGQILRGGGNEPHISYNFDYRQMSLTEFQSMNETELENTFGQGIGGSHASSTRFSTGCRGIFDDEDYLWVLRIVNVGGKTEGRITVFLRVVIRVHPF